MPIREFQCKSCGHIVEDIMYHPEDSVPRCPHCETDSMSVLPSAVGGYTIRGSNSSSTRPRNAGAFRRTRV